MKRPPADPRRFFVVHIYNPAGFVNDYYVRQALTDAVSDAAIDVVDGEDEDLDADARTFAIERARTCFTEEPGVRRWHVRHERWRAHIDEMPVR